MEEVQINPEVPEQKTPQVPEPKTPPVKAKVKEGDGLEEASPISFIEDPSEKKEEEGEDRDKAEEKNILQDLSSEARKGRAAQKKKNADILAKQSEIFKANPDVQRAIKEPPAKEEPKKAGNKQKKE